MVKCPKCGADMEFVQSNLDSTEVKKLRFIYSATTRYVCRHCLTTAYVHHQGEVDLT